MDIENVAEMQVEQAIGLLRSAAVAMRSVTTPPTDEVKAIRAAVNALQAREADLLATIDETKAHEVEGCASVATWARRELRQDAGTTRQLVKAAKTMRTLPAIGVAARAGEVSIEQVHALTYGLKHVGHDETVEVEDELLTVARQQTPGEVFALMRRCKAIAHPDELDKAWLKGMDKEDFRCVPVGDGFVPVGHFGIDLGAKIRAYLNASSVPRDADDTRTCAERRIDGLDDLFTKALADGLTSEGAGVKPHVSVIVQAETLKDALNGEATTPQGSLLDAEPALLEGFGPIGPALLAYIAWGGNLTPIMVAGFKENRRVLDVGRTRRLATAKQRRAIWYRQKGRCANRGCHHPIGEIHHVIDWLYGGQTNLSNLAGLCRKCHALISTGRLQMTGTFDTGYTFSTARAGPLARTG